MRRVAAMTTGQPPIPRAPERRTEMSKSTNNVNLQQLSLEFGATDASDKPQAERPADENGWPS